MTTTAQYSLTTGLIAATITGTLSSDQTKALAAAGTGCAVIPDGKNGGTGMIDVSSGAYVDYAPAGVPVPHIFLQYIAAQINSGMVPASSFHPSNLIDMNSQLAAAGMATVAVPDGATISASLAKATLATP